MDARIQIQTINRNEGIITEQYLKTLCQKGNFFFCHDVFKSRLPQMRPHAAIGGKGLTLLVWKKEELKQPCLRTNGLNNV